VNHLKQFLRLSINLARGRLVMQGLSSRLPDPINVTFSVTRRCQSKCKTCFIWKHDPGEDIDLETVESLFRSIGWTYFFNVSGGEPFLRKDLPEIIGLACRFMTPAVVHIPTNALAPERILKLTEEILAVIHRETPGTVLSIKPSFDGVGDLHDRIRGVPGNFERLMETLRGLERLRSEHPNLHVGVGTVISKYNYDRLAEIIEFTENLGVDTYINEIAEEREEFFNVGSGITPAGDKYGEIMKVFKDAVFKRMKGMRLLPRMTTALRLVYYDLVVKILERKEQVIPCYAGILNVHVNSDGGIWPCAVLAYRGEMGRVGVDGDFRSIWNSGNAERVRKSIKRGECYCPLANQAYSNILMHPPSLFKTILYGLGLRNGSDD